VGVTLLIPELPQCSPFELASAVRRTIADGPRTSPARALEGQLPSSEALREAGEQLVDADAADGLDAEERQALSALISHLVGSAPPERVCDVLDWLDERLAEDGLQARMERVAASFETRAEREQVLGFAALLALADRHLELEEQNALLRLGDVLGFRRAEVQMLVHKISLRLERAMAVSLRPQPPEEDRDTPPPDTPPAGSGTGTPPTERSG
jgi:tellurite resistance protein